jgi:hypothetical protein
MNKRAEEEFELSPLWVVTVVFVGFFIIAGVLIFYSGGLDVKGKEADILASRISGCLIKEGYLNFELENLDKAKIFSSCYLNKGVLDSENYYIGISFFKLEDCSNAECKNPKAKIEMGNNGYAIYCKLNGRNYPECSDKRIYISGIKKDAGKAMVKNIKEGDILVNSKGKFIVDKVEIDKEIKIYSGSVLLINSSSEVLISNLNFVDYIENSKMIVRVLAASNNFGGGL